MHISKRGLLKVIILLVIVDAVAGMWYLMLRIENSGESHDLWDSDHGNVTALADTIDQTSIPDTFKVVEEHAYYISQERTNPSIENSHMASIKAVTVRMPVSINGNDSLVDLEKALMDKAFSFTARSLAQGMKRFTEQPHFNNDANLSYKEVNLMPDMLTENTNWQRVLIYPIATSHRLLVMEIESRRATGDKHNVTTSYVHYDRRNQSVLKRSDILSGSDDHAVLALINSKIDELNKSREDKILHAAKVPYEINVARNGTMFIFPPGEIASLSEGEIEILVPHKSMSQHYTEAFRKILDGSTGWWNYKKLK